jgi:phospholipase A1
VADFGGNPGTGKGTGLLDATYALSDLIGLNLYLTGQMFTGYGESLLIYNRKDTRVRFGFSIIR